MADAAPPETMGLTEFAKAQRWKPSYVTQLKRDGRLVLTENGRRVRVAESLRLITDTSDPSKIGVKARHAAARGAPKYSASTSPAESPAPSTTADKAGDADPATVRYDDPLSMRRAKAQAEREEAALRKQLREEQIDLGELLQRDDVVAAVGDAVTTLRTSLQNLPSTLAPELAAATTDGQCQVLLANGIEHVLEEMARTFGAIGKVAA